MPASFVQIACDIALEKRRIDTSTMVHTPKTILLLALFSGCDACLLYWRSGDCMHMCCGQFLAGSAPQAGEDVHGHPLSHIGTRELSIDVRVQRAFLLKVLLQVTTARNQMSPMIPGAEV